MSYSKGSLNFDKRKKEKTPPRKSPSIYLHVYSLDHDQLSA